MLSPFVERFLDASLISSYSVKKKDILQHLNLLLYLFLSFLLYVPAHQIFYHQT